MSEPSQNPFFVQCPARLSPFPDSPDSEKMQCILPYGHIDPRMHATSDEEYFSFETGIEVVRITDSSDETTNQPE